MLRVRILIETNSYNNEEKGTCSEVVEHPVSVSLRHLSVNVETAESKFCDLFGQKFNSLSGIAEDDGLIDLKLREQGVQAVNLKTVDFRVILSLKFNAHRKTMDVIKN